MKNRFWIVGVVAGFLAVTAAQAQWRQAGPPARGERPSADEAGIGVARVSVADGEVEVRRGQSGDRMKARGGMPVLGDNTVTTGKSSRAELQFGQGNFVRMNSETVLRVVEIGNRFFHVEVLEGDVTYTQMKGGESDVTIHLHSATVYPRKPGEYRVSVRPGAQSDITVRKGEAEVASNSDTEKLGKGRRMTIRGEGDEAQFRVVKAGDRDAFDDWAKRRDKMLEGRPPHWARGWYPNFGVGFGHGWGGFHRPYIGVGVSHFYRGRGWRW